MLSIFAKCLLVSTSLSPVLGAVAVNQIERGVPWPCWIWSLVLALLLVLLCWALLRYAAKNAQKCLFSIEVFEHKDQEVLTFLFIYLLPFLRSEQSALTNDWLMSAYILTIIVLAIAHANAFHFNPVMRMVGYRFYAVKNSSGISNILISEADLRQSGIEVQTVRLAWNVYLQLGDEDA